jgi:hypothetical protein
MLKESLHNLTLLSLVLCPLLAVFGGKLYAPLAGEFTALTFAYLLLIHPFVAWVLFQLLENWER